MLTVSVNLPPINSPLGAVSVASYKKCQVNHIFQTYYSELLIFCGERAEGIGGIRELG